MLFRISRRGLAALTLLLVLLLPSLALARPQARTARPITPAAHPGLIDLLQTGLIQLLNKVLTSGDTTSSSPTPQPTPTPTPTPAPGSGAGVRIDPEGVAASPAPSPTAEPVGAS
jgi:hypothetical protein